MTYRELQATRVLSVDAYWQELREPSRRTPREIPVPLWPGESLQQYEREFGRWLAARRLSLVSMREDPVTERNYRLQFAQTRVARPAQQRHPSGPRSRSRSRSPSRSPPHKRRFIGAQQHPIQREDRGYVYGRKPSPDTGRLIAARQTAVRLVPERNYPRDRPQVTRGYSAAPEVSRVHDNWQAQRGVEPRPRQDTRPSPRAAHRQYVGDAQRWTRSPSPEYYSNRAVSPQRSDRSFSSQVRRSASPHDQARSNVDILRKQLLARRVISVDAFRDEMYKLRNGIIREDALKRPLETMVRIPIILWPGETMAQYTQKFERWLDSRKMSLASLRDNPARERSLWHTFAYTRAGASDLGEPAHSSAPLRSPSSMNTRSRSRSRSRSSSRSTRGSSERGRPTMPAGYGESKPLQRGYVSNPPVNPPRRDRSYSPEQRRRSRSPSASIAPAENPRLFSNKTRRQLLERRILELDAFQKEVGQNAWAEGANTAEGAVIAAIPVPLHPGESTGLYDHRFWTWLKNYNETKESLSDNPARERRFRMAFAYLRVKRPQSSTVVGAQRAQDPRPRVESQNKIPLGVLKSARARLATNLKRSSEESELQTQVRSKESSAKRTRTEVFISVKVGTNYKNVVNKNLYFDGNLRFDNTSSAISHHAFGTSFYGSKNESSSCSQYAFGGSSQGSKSEFGVNNYGAFGKNDNYVLSSQIRSFLNRFRSRDHSCSSTTVKLSDSPIARGTKNKT
ncbi:hypothetical protein PC123_g997 [Phytophthora cactorum]|nr:hypothetical protein PC123_g997 [Phytophthora cactorum]